MSNVAKDDYARLWLAYCRRVLAGTVDAPPQPWLVAVPDDDDEPDDAA